MGLDGVLPFDRGFSDPRQRLSYVGAGSLGGKASGLGFIQELLTSEFDAALFPDIDVGVPRLTVLLTSVFDEFIRRNGLRDVADGDASDTYIAYAFQKADLPAEFLGDLRALVEHVHTPLAVRSSSLLEDARDEPFAGVYGTKMIPNNQESADERFRRLMEAIKFVYASTFFGGARGYLRATRHRPSDERMAVIIQEVVGARFGDRFYPALSGVARSFNYYPQGRARPADGVASLALGLGKTIVDGDACWTYALEYPRIAPPFSSAEDTFRETQTRFWAVNMAKPPAYDPIHETEYLMKSDLGDAEQDGTLRFIASTYDAQSGSISLGTGKAGPRVLTFAPLLTMNEIAVNDLVRNLVRLAERKLESPVEIEFAMTFNPHRFGFLQVRPMAVSDAAVTVSEEEMAGPGVLAASRRTLGNGVIENIRDVVYVKPERFEPRHTPRIALDLEAINKSLVAEGRPYALIGFGRWGSSDPWLGIPVEWGQIAGTRVLVEVSGGPMNADLSQGSHFFHNLTSFRVGYLSVTQGDSPGIDWAWLRAQPAVAETDHVRHVRRSTPLSVRMDGRTGMGLIVIAE